VQGEFKPRGEQFMHGEFPWPNIKRLGEMGILGMAVPKAYGGMELGVFDTRVGARGNRQGLLRHRDGGAGRGRHADPHHRDLCVRKP